jgi:hypothetical protein
MAVLAGQVEALVFVEVAVAGYRAQREVTI